MNEVRQQVALAHRRLVIEQFVGRAIWCLLGTFSLAVAAIAMARVVTLESLPEHWDAIVLGLAAIVGLAAAFAWTLYSRRSELDAAVEIDRRFDLRERIASSISLSQAELHTEAGQAVLRDATRALARIDVGSKFRIPWNRRAWLPLVPATAAFLLMLLVNSPVATSRSAPNGATPVAQQIRTAAESARKKLELQRKEAQRRGLKETEGLFKKIEAGTKSLAEKPGVDRTEAAVKLNDLAQQLAARRRQLGGKESLQKQLQNLKPQGNTPGDKIARAMKQGDFQQAAREIDKLAEQLRTGNLDEKAKHEVGRQLDALKKQLDAAADAQRQAMDNLQKQIEQQRQSGDMAKAGELQQKLDEMAGDAAQAQQIQKLAAQMGQAQQSLQHGDAQKAAESMRQMAQQISKMQQEAHEAQMLDEATEQLQIAKDAMARQGAQSSDSQGGTAQQPGQQSSVSMNASRPGQSSNSPGSRPGSGIGKGRGNGTANDTSESSSRATQVRQQPGAGPAVFAGTVAGPNIKGNVKAEIQTELAEFGSSTAEPVSSDELPRNRREHAAEYFNHFREGEK